PRSSIRDGSGATPSKRGGPEDRSISSGPPSRRNSSSSASVSHGAASNSSLQRCSERSPRTSRASPERANRRRIQVRILRPSSPPPPPPRAWTSMGRGAAGPPGLGEKEHAPRQGGNDPGGARGGGRGQHPPPPPPPLPLHAAAQPPAGPADDPVGLQEQPRA